MTRSVRLDRLPAGLQFPQEMAAKISFDAARQRLQFQGFMSKTDFDKLVRLHNDLAYQRALQELFQTCTFTTVSSTASSSTRRMPFVFAGVAAAAFVMLALFFWLRH